MSAAAMDRTPDQYARERAELERADREPAEVVRGGDLVRVDFGRASLDRLRALQSRAGARFVPTEAEIRRAQEADDPEARRRVRRRNNLVTAGVGRPEAAPQREAWDRVVNARNAAEAAMPGHPGSMVAMRTVAQWLSGVEPWATLVFVGEPGTGKTVAGWAALAKDGGLYVGADDAAPSSRWDAIRDRAKAARLVVLNDVSERLSELQWGLVAALVEDRHDRGMRTLVTTNLARKRLLELFGPRVADRIGPTSGDGQGAVVVVPGESMRRRA